MWIKVSKNRMVNISNAIGIDAIGNSIYIQYEDQEKVLGEYPTRVKAEKVLSIIFNAISNNGDGKDISWTFRED